MDVEDPRFQKTGPHSTQSNQQEPKALSYFKHDLGKAMTGTTPQPSH